MTNWFAVINAYAIVANHLYYVLYLFWISDTHTHADTVTYKISNVSPTCESNTVDNLCQHLIHMLSRVVRFSLHRIWIFLQRKCIKTVRCNGEFCEHFEILSGKKMFQNYLLHYWSDYESGRQMKGGSDRFRKL